MGGLADDRVEQHLAALASRAEPPAAGVAAAMACASAAALVELTAGLAADRLAADGPRAEERAERMRAFGARARELRMRLPHVADEDVAAYGPVMRAVGDRARSAALARASGPPLEVAESAAEIAEAAAEVAAAGDWPFTADAVVAGRLAAAAAAGGAELVAANLGRDGDDPRVARAREAAERARRAIG